MLSHTHRFHGPHSLRTIYRSGQTVHSHICKVKYLQNARREDSRFAIVVSKKVHKSAIGRNRIRRRFYEVIRGQISALKPGVDVVVIIVSGEALAMPYSEIEATIRQLFHEANLYQ